MRKKSILAVLLAIIMIVSMFPATAFATESDNVPQAQAMDENGLHMTKNATLEDDGTYTINLEAFVTGTVTVTNTTTSKPTDVVLVLDISGSMYEPMSDSESAVTNPDTSKPAGYYSMDATTRYYPVRWSGSQWQYYVGGNWYPVGSRSIYESRMGALMEAVNSFVNATAEANAALAEDQMHKISIVAFNGTASTKLGLTTVTGTGQTDLLNAIAELGTSGTGSTNAKAGMETAADILNNSGDRAKAVIMFTDGEPTTSSAYDDGIAVGAIDASLQMKTEGTRVFTISVLSNANIDDVSGTETNASTANKMNTYMNAVSSNYPEACSTDGAYPIVLNSGSATDGYYKKASNASELSSIFGEIQNTIISGSSSYNLDTSAVLKDIMNTGFSLTNASATAKVYNYNFSGKAFATTSSADLTATINGNTVSVTGFDYAKHFVPLNQTNDNPNGGKKVVVEITGVTATNEVAVGELVSTNDTLSGMYANSTAETPVEPFQQPLTQFASEVYVLDYAKSVTVSADDWAISGLMTLDIDGMDKFTTGVKTLGDLVHGTASWNNSNSEVTYKPQSTNWNSSDSFYAFGQWETTPTGVTTGDNAWAKVSFIPASNVYYEDDFTTNTTDGTVGITYGDGWSVVYDGKTTTGAVDGNTETINGNIAGWEESLSDDAQFSDGSAHISSTATATAYFTFTGTGVDIYSYTDMESGLVTAALNKLDANGNVISGETKYLMVDNLAVSNGTNGYYQIPTLSFQDLEYGTYKLGLVVNRGKTVETDENGKPVTDADGNLVYKTDAFRSTYYLDGIRVYNPLGTTVYGEVADAYGQNIGIDDASIKTVYKAVNTLIATSGTTENAVFTDLTASGEVAVADYYNSTVYATYGPKNEVYLAPGQSIVFSVDSAIQYYVGLKSLKGNKVTVNAAFSNGEKQSITTIGHSTDLYYKVTPTTDAEGYSYITVKNNSTETDAILAVTKLQMVGPVEASSFSLRTISDEEAVTYATTFTAMDEVEYGEEPVEPELPDVEIPDEEPATPDTEQPEDTLSQIEEIISFVNKLFNALNKWFGRR